MTAAATVLVVAAFLSVTLGTANLSFTQLLKAIREGAGSGFEGNIFWYVRLPRTAACLLAGAGLSVSGVVIQGVLANKLASPGIIGVNAGAGFAVTLCCALGTISGWAIAGSAFIGAFLAVMFVALAAQKRISRITVPMMLKDRCTMEVRRALRLVPMEESIAVTQVPMFCPIMMGTAAP